MGGTHDAFSPASIMAGTMVPFRATSREVSPFSFGLGRKNKV